MDIYIYIYVYVDVNLYVDKYMCICMYIYIYIHMAASRLFVAAQVTRPTTEKEVTTLSLRYTHHAYLYNIMHCFAHTPQTHPMIYTFFLMLHRGMRACGRAASAERLPHMQGSCKGAHRVPVGSP